MPSGNSPNGAQHVDLGQGTDDCAHLIREASGRQPMGSSSFFGARRAFLRGWEGTPQQKLTHFGGPPPVGVSVPSH